MDAPIVEMRGISKRFGGVHALRDVDVHVDRGEVLAIVGHNGAGKSTLIKILSGALEKDDGEILLDGTPVTLRSPRDAKAHGIETIYQQLALAENLAAPANIFLGRERTGPLGVLDDEAMEVEARKVLDRLDLKIQSLRESVRQLSGGQRQAIAIGRAIHFDARVLIMDEPTAALGPAETEKVAQLVANLRREGLAIVLISHDIHDVFDLADRIAVLHNGRLVDTVRTDATTKEEVLGMIIMGSPPAGRGAAAAGGATGVT